MIWFNFKKVIFNSTVLYKFRQKDIDKMLELLIVNAFYIGRPLTSVIFITIAYSVLLNFKDPISCHFLYSGHTSIVLSGYSSFLELSLVLE